MSLPISALILTKNSEKTIKETLSSLQEFSQVVVLDTGSEDHTLKICHLFPNVVVHQEKFSNFGAIRNLATHYALYDWIFVIDSDEVLSKKGLEEIKKLNLDPSCVYSFSRKNFFNNKSIRGCGWFPDRVIRLYHRKMTCYSSDFVHEKILVDNVIEVKTQGYLEHYSYHEVGDFLEKMQKYSTLFAQMNRYKKNSSPLKALNHSIFAFIKSFFIKKGFLDGWEGFIISYYNAQTTFYKYLKLWELNKDAYYE